jgi:glycosyltransferase involved in cell wall biosynthesis
VSGLDLSGEPTAPKASRPGLAMVVQRYGQEVTGGSESLCRAVAERLASDYRVTVFTTCATDYVTWRNVLPEGTQEIQGVEVLRFPVEEERDLDAFNRFAELLYLRATTRAEELLFLRRQGPYVPQLVEALAARKAEFEAVLFFTYLYYPTVRGLEVAPERAILVPTTHDEPPLRFSIYAEMFDRPRGFAFLTRPEETLVRSRFDLRGRPAEVTGMGVETPEQPDVEGFRIRHRQHRPYALYAGRIDAGKGCDEMLAFFDRYRQTFPGAADLLLIGNLAMAEPRVPGVRYLGYLSEDEKHAAMAGAKAVVCPSPYESLSIVLLEAFSLGVPGLVSTRSAVLEDHCRRSNGGLFYRNGEEFAEALDLLVCGSGVGERLGRNGRTYVRAEYAWPAVLARYRSLIEAVKEQAGS